MSDTTMSMAEMVQRKAELDALLRQVTSETAMLSKGIREANAAVSTASISTLSKTSVRYGIGTETMVIAAVLKVTDTIQAKGGTLPANWEEAMADILRSNLCQGAEKAYLGAVNVSEANGVYTVEGRFNDDKSYNHFTVSNNPDGPIKFEAMDREGMGEMAPINDSAA